MLDPLLLPISCAALFLLAPLTVVACNICTFKTKTDNANKGESALRVAMRLLCTAASGPPLCLVLVWVFGAPIRSTKRYLNLKHFYAIFVVYISKDAALLALFVGLLAFSSLRALGRS